MPRSRSRQTLPAMVPAGEDALDEAVSLIAKYDRIVIKAGGGARGADSEVRQLAESDRRGGGAVARIDRRAARRPSAEHACRRVQRFDLRQLRHGERPASDRHRHARRLPGGLLRHRLSLRRSRHQHQWRPVRSDALRQYGWAAGRCRCGDRAAAGARRPVERRRSGREGRLAGGLRREEDGLVRISSASVSKPPRSRTTSGASRFSASPRRSRSSPISPRRWAR